MTGVIKSSRSSGFTYNSQGSKPSSTFFYLPPAGSPTRDKAASLLPDRLRTSSLLPDWEWPEMPSYLYLTSLYFRTQKWKPLKKTTIAREQMAIYNASPGGHSYSLGQQPESAPKKTKKTWPSEVNTRLRIIAPLGTYRFAK